jgi:hypothetical protein
MLNRPDFHSDKALEAPADASVFEQHADGARAICVTPAVTSRIRELPKP